MYSNRRPKHGYRTHLSLVESSTLEELAYSKCNVAVVDWIIQTKLSPALRKVTLEGVKWYRSPEHRISQEQLSVAIQMTQYLPNLQTPVVQELDIETDPTSFEFAILEALISHTRLDHLVIFAPNVGIPRLTYPRCLDHSSNLTKVTLSISFPLIDERLSIFVATTTTWLSPLHNLSSFELKDSRLFPRYRAEITPLLISVLNRIEANRLASLSYLSLLRCSFDYGTLLSLSYARSPMPHGLLPPSTRKSPVRISLQHCKTRLDMKHEKATWKSKLVPVPYIKNASWGILRSAILHLEGQANAKTVNGKGSDTGVSDLYGSDSFGLVNPMDSSACFMNSIGFVFAIYGESTGLIVSTRRSNNVFFCSKRNTCENTVGIHANLAPEMANGHCSDHEINDAVFAGPANSGRAKLDIERVAGRLV
jgi:hypothetical protein